MYDVSPEALVANKKRGLVKRSRSRARLQIKAAEFYCTQNNKLIGGRLCTGERISQQQQQRQRISTLLGTCCAVKCAGVWRESDAAKWSSLCGARAASRSFNFAFFIISFLWPASAVYLTHRRIFNFYLDSSGGGWCVLCSRVRCRRSPCVQMAPAASTDATPWWNSMRLEYIRTRLFSAPLFCCCCCYLIFDVLIWWCFW